MRKITALTVILLLASCASAQPQVQDPVPERNSGCKAETNFNKKMDCISKMVKRLEDIENAIRTTEVKDETRFDEYWVVVTYEDCYADFCRQRRTIEYKPTMWARIKEDAVKIFSGALLGAGIVLAL